MCQSAGWAPNECKVTLVVDTNKFQVTSFKLQVVSFQLRDLRTSSILQNSYSVIFDILPDMQILLTNTRTKQKEVFEPLTEGEVRMYHCGPTVYDRAHIGNLRSYVFADLLRRVFEYNNFSVVQVMNITDIGHLSDDADDGEDKMMLALHREGLDPSHTNLRTVAEKHARTFFTDLAELNILHPNQTPFASDHVPEMISLIQNLSKKEFTYQTSDGIYFDTSRDSNFGALGGVMCADQHSRIEKNLEKKRSCDFALWKFNSEYGYDAPFGSGFPGWHIECSAMAMKYLGESFDIHTGGIDHIAVHHNNEIAQSENATGQTFARYWMHNAFVTLDQEKIAKSLGNIITLGELVEKGTDPLAYRYLLLQARYSSPTSFSFRALDAAQNALQKLRKITLRLRDDTTTPTKPNSEYQQRFHQAINDDLDIPTALATLWEMVGYNKLSLEEKYASILDFDRVLGLQLADFEITEPKITPEVQTLIDKRNEARDRQDWETADRIRDELHLKGISVQDTDLK